MHADEHGSAFMHELYLLHVRDGREIDRCHLHPDSSTVRCFHSNALERLRGSSWEALRTFRVRSANEHVVEAASWHLGYLMTPREIVTKLCLNTDPVVRGACADANIEDKVTRAVAGCRDPFGRRYVRLERRAFTAAGAVRADALPAFATSHLELFANITKPLECA